ncbi:MAG: hypothetical protein Kow0063_33010 [Anaerolineae bacterium]
MRFKAWLLVLYLVLVALSASVSAASAQEGQARLIIINFVGDEMSFTLDGTPYAIPGTDTAPGGGQMTFTLAAGRHTFSGHVPGSEGTNAEVTLGADETRVLGARLERTRPVISPAGVVLEAPRDILVFFEASLAPPSPTPEPQLAPLRPLAAGQGALVLVNYIGEALIVDIGGELYTVPANDRLQIDLPPGEVRYSASAGFSGINGIALVTAGSYTGLGFTRQIPPEEPDYQVGDLEPTPVPLQISVFPVSLEVRPVGETPSPQSRPDPDPASQGALRVVNYVGETLTFTIDNQAYSVAGGGGRLSIDLRPGEYTFTASTPGAASNGSLRISGEATTQVSVALDVGSGEIRVFIE